MMTDPGSQPSRRAQGAAYQGPGAGYAPGSTFIAFIKNMASTEIVTSR